MPCSLRATEARSLRMVRALPRHEAQMGLERSTFIRRDSGPILQDLVRAPVLKGTRMRTPEPRPELGARPSAIGPAAYGPRWLAFRSS